ncbi:unnamed protein product [Debaryomyces fabryi]|nr:unnamed protein product [Debaryomyces fabryi]
MRDISIINLILLLVADLQEIRQARKFLHLQIRKSENKVDHTTEENQNSPYKIFTEGFRNGTRCFLFFSAVRILGRKISKSLHPSRVISKYLKHIPVISENDLVHFSKFVSILISSKPFVKTIILKVIEVFKNTSLTEKEKLIASSLANFVVCGLSIYLYFPKAFFLHTVSWFYCIYGIEYSYRLFEKKQLKRIERNAVKDNSVSAFQTSSLLTTVFTYTENKSWLMFPLAVSYTWREYIVNPKNVHDLALKFFKFVGDRFSNVLINGDLIACLRCYLLTEVNIKLTFKNLFLVSLPNSYFDIFKFVLPLTIVKYLSQNINKDNKKHDKDTSNKVQLFKKILKESIKFTTFLTAVPTLLYVLTSILFSYTYKFRQIYGYELRIIGFIGGLFAYMYRGKKRYYSEEMILTNREAWLSIIRETIIASTNVAYIKNRTNKLIIPEYMENIDRAAFSLGLATIITIQEYLSNYPVLSKDIFSDAKVLSWIYKKVQHSNMFLLN